MRHFFIATQSIGLHTFWDVCCVCVVEFLSGFLVQCKFIHMFHVKFYVYTISGLWVIDSRPFWTIGQYILCRCNKWWCSIELFNLQLVHSFPPVWPILADVWKHDRWTLCHWQGNHSDVEAHVTFNLWFAVTPHIHTLLDLIENTMSSREEQEILPLKH